MMKLTLLSAALLAFGDSAVNALSSCGQSQYDPAQVCLGCRDTGAARGSHVTNT